MWITDKPIDSGTLIKAVESPEAGAVVTFNGVVRNNSGGRDVLRMEYEAHTEMAEQLMADLSHVIKRKFNIIAIALQHRTGILEIGESSIMIAVSAPHRAEAFKACRYAIDTVKSTLPVWKKEFFKDGSSWVEGTTVKPIKD